MSWIATLALLFAGVVHLLPAVGVTGGTRLRSLYGTETLGPELELLLRHRAVMFAMFGAGLVYAAFHEPLHAPALGAGLVSAGSFIALAPRETNVHIVRVVRADVACVIALLIASVASLR